MNKKIPAAGLLAALAITLAACSTVPTPSAANGAAGKVHSALVSQKQLRAVRVSQESQAG